jgi:hypothetical protein
MECFVRRFCSGVQLKPDRSSLDFKYMYVRCLKPQLTMLPGQSHENRSSGFSVAIHMHNENKEGLELCHDGKRRRAG